MKRGFSFANTSSFIYNRSSFRSLIIQEKNATSSFLQSKGCSSDELPLFDYLERTAHDRKCEMGHILHILKSKLHTVILINLCVGAVRQLCCCQCS